MVVALPVSVGFGIASGMGAAAGLYRAIAVGFFASVFGGTRSQISGPTAPMSVAMAVVLTSHADSLSKALTVVVLAGLLRVLPGVSRIGRFVAYTPHVVMSGFMSGIGWKHRKAMRVDERGQAIIASLSALTLLVSGVLRKRPATCAGWVSDEEDQLSAWAWASTSHRFLSMSRETPTNRSSVSASPTSPARAIAARISLPNAARAALTASTWWLPA